MISDAITKQPGELVKTVVAVDPAVSNQENSDETGIIVASVDNNGDGVVQADLSCKTSTATWAQRAVNAYYQYDANYIVVEVNQGGDLVEDVLKNIDNSIKVVKVRASKGKFARAEPISELYELGKVAHVEHMLELEDQLTQYVPLNSKKSPDRLDALVWALTDLILDKKRKIHVAF
jgi:phage terminase large subunit-like protein